MEYPKSRNAEEALSHSLMYLYQAFTEEQKLNSDVAKSKVIEAVQRCTKKFEGEDRQLKLNKTKNTNFDINNIKTGIESLKALGTKNQQVKYLAENIELSFNKILKELV